MMWDFVEGFPFSGAGGDWTGAVEWVAQVLEANGDLVARAEHRGQAQYASATLQPLPSDSAAIVVTDPPYYDAIPYGTISDFFYVWLKRTLGSSFPELFSWPLIPKDQECAVDDAKGKDREFFAHTMTSAMKECRRVLMPSGIAVVIFANTSTEAWETQLASMIEAGLIITGSWPIDTEMAARLRARDSAALASSICLVARPREEKDGSVASNTVGDWREVLEELPRRIRIWLPRLAEEGVVGADAIFACLGPALEIFSRYARVEKVSGDHVQLREYLEHVWAVVSREALARIFEGAETGGLEADARLSAMWLWTVAAGRVDNVVVTQAEIGEFSESEEDEAGESGKATHPGFALDFDTARKIAQGLGARLEELTHVVAVEGQTARLLSVTERAKHLFSVPERHQVAKRLPKKEQMPLFAHLAETAKERSLDDVGAPSLGATTLDQIHQAMLLFASGRGEALKRFLVEERAGSQTQFWKLAQSLSALYPSGSDERRWVEGVLARKKGLGFG